MAKVIFVLGLMLLAMVASADKSEDESPSKLVKVSLKVNSECEKEDVFILVEELGDDKPKPCKHKKKTDIGHFDLDLDLNHLIHLKFSLLNGQDNLVEADLVIDLLQLGLVEDKEDLTLDLVDDLVENTVKCFLYGELVLTISL